MLPIVDRMLNREQIEAALRGEAESPGLSIREALETALALYQENERLKTEVQIQSAFLAEAAKNADKIAAWGKILDRNAELEAENARLLEADESAKRVIDGLVATQDILQRDIDLLREELKELNGVNEVLREQNTATAETNLKLEAVVEAATEAVLCVGFADMMATCPSVRAELEPIRDRFLAALEKVSNP